MSAHAALFERAQLSPQTTALIGASDDCRMFNGEIEQDAAMPAILTERVSYTETHSMGESGPPLFSRFRLHCWAATPSEAQALGETIREDFRSRPPAGYGWPGFFGSYGGITVLACYIDNIFDFGKDLETGRHRTVVELRLVHE